MNEFKCSKGANKVSNDEDTIKERISKHPCYCEDAHTKYARMHIAVAPKCNIQCGYCDRRFDCQNESRPGVSSKILNLEEAVEHFHNVKNKVDNLSVVGIAGPGDPLANPNEVFGVFKKIHEADKDIKLCLSTNGLMLKEYVDQIASLGVDHVTITINAIDPDAGAKIYTSIRFNGVTYKGTEAAQILIGRQLEGLALLVKKGIIVKVNTVLIPEYNMSEIEKIAKTIKDAGAFIHNIIPLISMPTMNTPFNKLNVRVPTNCELNKARMTSASVFGSMSRVMKHCKQCRADAVGMLGQDLNIS